MTTTSRTHRNLSPRNGRPAMALALAVPLALGATAAPALGATGKGHELELRKRDPVVCTHTRPGPKLRRIHSAVIGLRPTYARPHHPHPGLRPISCVTRVPLAPVRGR